jgi:hypothetical protein
MFVTRPPRNEAELKMAEEEDETLDALAIAAVADGSFDLLENETLDLTQKRNERVTVTKTRELVLKVTTPTHKIASLHFSGKLSELVYRRLK